MKEVVVMEDMEAIRLRAEARERDSITWQAIDQKSAWSDREFKKQLNLGFANLRAARYVARQNWQCCMSCGCAALPEGTTRYAFYHRQNKDTMYGADSRWQRHASRPQGLFLSWGGDPGVIVRAFEAAGFKAFHDGSEYTKVYVRAPTETEVDQSLPCPAADPEIDDRQYA